MYKLKHIFGQRKQGIKRYTRLEGETIIFANENNK
jgi:hypothetical protein